MLQYCWTWKGIMIFQIVLQYTVLADYFKHSVLCDGGQLNMPLEGPLP